MCAEVNSIVYLEIGSRIKELILAGDLKDKLPSEKELAQKYNVNFKTVNKAVSALVSEGVLYRVRGIGAFVKKDVKKNLESGQKNIGLAVFNMKWLYNPFYSGILAGIGEVVQKNGHNLQFLTTNNEPGSHRGLYYMDAWAQGRFDGMIIAGEEINDDDIIKLNAKKYPFILLGNYLPNKRLSTVCIDNYKGGYDAATHLINQGHQRIAFIRGFDSKSDKERVAGCRDAMQKKKLSLPANYIKSGYYDEEKSYVAMTELLKLERRPTAVIASDDVMAASAMQAIKNGGFSVPDDISVIGFNDSVLASKVTPPLTTLRISVYDMGKTAIEMLEEKFREKTFSSEKKLFTPELIIRKSTAERK